jgi:hypothetical protein
MTPVSGRCVRFGALTDLAQAYADALLSFDEVGILRRAQGSG